MTICHKNYDNLQIDHNKAQEPTSMALYHYHSSYEIYYLISGVRNYFIKDRTYRVEKGDIVLINRNDLHKTAYGGSQAHERILINFEEEFVTEMMPCITDIDVLYPFHKDIHLVRLKKSEQMAAEQILFKIMKEAKEKDNGSETSVRLSVLELLIFVTRRAIRQETGVNEHIDQMHEKISEIVRYINKNYMDKLTLRNISESFYISPCHLSRLFKKATGFTFVEYLNSIRIKEARRLLLESNMGMERIAESTGYESSTHFGRVFKQITGLSPLRFRKINKSVD